MREMLKQFFIASDGGLRAIWRAAIYYAAGTFLVFPLLGRPVAIAARSLHLTLGLTAGYIALAELRNLVVALICTGVFAVYERHRCSRNDHAGRHADHRMGWHWQRAHAFRAGMARRKCLRRHRRGILVPILSPANALEKHRLLAVRHCHSAHLCCRTLFLQGRREPLGRDHTCLAESALELLHAADGHAVVRRRFSLCLRLHAALRHRNAEWRTISGRADAGRALQWPFVADRRCARYRSKLLDVPGDRASVALRLVALSCKPATSAVSTGTHGRCQWHWRQTLKGTFRIEGV